MTEQKKLTSQKPFFIRAIYEWLAENNGTPHVLINTRMEGVHLPSHLYDNQTLLLNLSMCATTALSLEGPDITFGARFNQVHHNVAIPVEAVIAVYAPDLSNAGMAFETTDLKQVKAVSGDENPTPPKEPSPAITSKPSFLRVVK